MKDYQKRMVEEKQELDVKRLKLHQFIATDEFLAIDETDRELLFKQAVLMDLYSETLEKRIDRFFVLLSGSVPK